MLDVNSFKQINDTYGHTEGDAVLRLVGRVLLKAVKGPRLCRPGTEAMSLS